MRITYRTLAQLIALMSSEQQDTDVTVEIPGEQGAECYSAELRIAGEEHDGGLDLDHPVIYVHLSDKDHRRISDVDMICKEIGLSTENKQQSVGLFAPEIVVDLPISYREQTLYKMFEVTLKGYDSSTDETDHLVKWIRCPSRELLNDWLALQKIEDIVLSVYESVDREHVGFGEGVDVVIVSLDRYSIYRANDMPPKWRVDAEDAINIEKVKQSLKNQPSQFTDYSDKSLVHVTPNDCSAAKIYTVRQINSISSSLQDIEDLLNDGWKIETLSHPTIVLSKTC